MRKILESRDLMREIHILLSVFSTSASVLIFSRALADNLEVGSIDIVLNRVTSFWSETLDNHWLLCSRLVTVTSLLMDGLKHSPVD